MINIQWSQFEQNQQAKDISFETFCFQIAYIKYKDFGYFDNFYNTPGSEFYLILHSDLPELNLKAGDEIGWQAKWWLDGEDKGTSLGQARRDKLIANFNTTISRHDGIKYWIICTPNSFNEDAYTKLKGQLKSISVNTEFSHWNKDVFNNFLTQDIENFNGLFNHYFNSNFIGFSLINKYSQRRIDDLQKKFDTDLYTPSHYDNEIFFVVDYKRIFDEFNIKSKYILDDVIEIENDDSYAKNSYGAFDKEYIETALSLLKRCIKESKECIEIINSGLSVGKVSLLNALLISFAEEYKESAVILDRKLKSKEHLVDKNNWKEKHFNDDYLIPSILKLRDYLISSKDDKESCLLKLVQSANTKDIHILSSAGYGKTNIACNICVKLIEQEIPSLLILGSSFRKSELPQTIILEQLGINKEYTFKQFLEALNTLGFSKGVKIPIIIDGLNESKPFDDIWKSNIKDIKRDIDELEFVILITTCRNRYVESIFEVTDITEIKNTKVLSGLSEKQRLKAIPKYFKKYNITPTSWNFNQELFINPLLLKIFSEVNIGKQDLHISLGNIFESLDTYINQIEEKASIVNSSVDRILKKKIKTRISLYCQNLWENSTREISLEDFHEIISPESNTIADSLTQKLLDEGLCFQRNLEEDDETVQFTYDLVAGYAIASKILLKSICKSDNIEEKLLEKGIENMLFNRETYHPLRQDILVSLIHLLPKYFDLHLFELFNNESVVEECFNNIDYFIGNAEGQQKILENIHTSKVSKGNIKVLCERLFENIYIKEIHGLGEFTIKVLSAMNQAEIDINWSELIRKSRQSVYNLLESINRKYLSSDHSEYCQELFICFLSTTSSDKAIRSIATENLYLIGKKNSNSLLDFADKVIPFTDINSVESFIVSVCGCVLSLRDKLFTEAVLNYLENYFIPNFKSTHICVIDYILTIQEFAKENFDLNFKDTVKFSQEFFDITKSKDIEKALDGNIHFPYIFGLDLYDFNKYQVSSIASDEYEERDTFSTIDCMAIIVSNIKRKGFEESTFEKITENFQEDNRYKYVRESNNNLVKYPEKYLWQAFLEFTGYLVLTGKLKPEYYKRYRSDNNFFDPTFPRLPQKFQLISDCFFPPKDANIQKWINSDSNKIVDDFIVHNLYTQSDWVLLSLSLGQEGKENDTRINIYLTSFLIAKERIKDFEDKIATGRFHHSFTTFHNLYAGEIDWSDFAMPVEPDYNEEELSMKELIREYSWSSWSSQRYEHPHFKFLNPELSKLLELDFNTDTLSFHNASNEEVTKIVWAESSTFYYIRKDLIEKLCEKLEMELIWYQFISKYGEYGKHSDNKLNPKYNDLKRVIKFKDII
jgi:hypothetical protein